MRIGAQNLLEDFGSPLAVAEALLEGRLNSFQQQFVADLVSGPIMEAARIRLERRIKEALTLLKENNIALPTIERSTHKLLGQ